jgi:acyl-CoA reductase-like NAD-dependent aldehyde dehydrogenase
MTTTDWHAAARALTPRTGCFIGGKTVAADNAATYERINPATGARVGEAAAAQPADVDRAVASARAAFERGLWARMAPRQRGQTLIRLAELLEAHADELSLLETLDIGKPIRRAA